MKGTYESLVNHYTSNFEKGQLIIDIKEGRKTTDDFVEDARNFLNEYYKDEQDKEGIIQQAIDNLFGYSIITPFIEDKDITDIKVHGFNNIVIKKNGKKSVADVKFESEEQYNRFINGVITRNRVNASNMNAIQRFDDTTTSKDFKLRFTLATPFLVSTNNYELIIRKTLKKFLSLDDLVDKKMMTPDIKDYLIDAWRSGSVLICGGQSSGKTTILNALKEETPHDKSVVVIQQVDELSPKDHPDMIFMEAVEGSQTESDVHYDLRELSIAALTMDIEYFIIGEIKGAEAAYLLNASYTGSICGGTVHGYSAETALDKVVDYALYTSNYTKPELLSMLTTFKTVVYMQNFKVFEIDEVTGMDGNKITYEPVYRINIKDM